MVHQWQTSWRKARDIRIGEFARQAAKNLNANADVILAWPQEPIGRRDDDRPFEDERDAHTDAVCPLAR